MTPQPFAAAPSPESSTSSTPAAPDNNAIAATHIPSVPLPSALAIDYAQLASAGFWRNNPALVQLLGLCPLLAVSGSVVNALGLGLATAAVLMSSNLVISLARRAVPDALRLPAFVMLIAALTTCIELSMQAFTFELYQTLGIFIPLIVTNCIILGRADAFACKNPPVAAAWDGLCMGLGFAAVLLVVGALREALGQGTLFANMHLLVGGDRDWTLNLFGPDYPAFLVAVLPPGAFFVVGFLIAAKNLIEARKKLSPTKTDSASRRVRTTGIIH
jgi:Na+-translocating ferredoxin:NAD+ oxidoreductase subunit E